MSEKYVPRATLGRLPVYLRYLESIQAGSPTVSAARMARELGYGEVQVRKDLGAVSGSGRPKVGYDTRTLLKQMGDYLGRTHPRQAVIVGAGKLGRALLDYEGFADYGLEVAAAFDVKASGEERSETGKAILPMEEFEGFCYRQGIRLGIIAVPKGAAQAVCDRMVKSNITAIWSFAPLDLRVPEHVSLAREDLALSLAYLDKQA